MNYVRIGVGVLAAALAGFYLLRAERLASTPRARAQRGVGPERVGAYCSAEQLPPAMRPPETAESSSPQARLEHAREDITRRDPLWPEHLAVLTVILLSITLPDQLTVGPTWLLPAVEGVLFAGLVATPRERAASRPAGGGCASRSSRS